MKRNSVPNLNAKMSNPRRSYCDFNIWSCCARLWDNFHQVWPSTTYPFLNFYADTLCHAVIDLDLWPLDLELLQHFGCQAFKLCTKFEGNRIIYRWVIDDLTHFRRAILGMEHDKRFSRLRGPNFTKLGEDIGRSFLHNKFVSAFGYLAVLSNASSSKLSDVENDAKFCTVWPLVKIRVGVGELPVVEALPTTEYISWPSTAWLRSVVDWLRKEKKRKFMGKP